MYLQDFLQMQEWEQAQYLLPLRDNPQFRLLREYVLDIARPNTDVTVGLDKAIEAMRFAFYLEGIQAVFNTLDAIVNIDVNEEHLSE